MTTVVTEFASLDPITGDPLYPGHETTGLTGSTSVTLRSTTRAVSITTDSATITANLGGRAAVASDMAPPARGYFLLRLSPQNATRNLVLTLANA